MPEQLVYQLTNQLHADRLAHPLRALQYDGCQPVDTGRELLHQPSLLPRWHISREASRNCPAQQRPGMRRLGAVFLSSPPKSATFRTAEGKR
jgi:hypothetical protein